MHKRNISLADLLIWARKYHAGRQRCAQARAAGDINLDGVADLIIQAAGGQVICVFMNADGSPGTLAITNPSSTSAQVRAPGDIDGGGIADLIGQLPTGEAAIWLMNSDGTVKGISMLYQYQTNGRFARPDTEQGSGLEIIRPDENLEFAYRRTPLQIRNYRSEISGPLLDRIDIHIEVPALSYHELAGLQAGEPSAEIRRRLVAAHNLQRQRFSGMRRVHCNAAMRPKDTAKFCALKDKAQAILKMAISELNFSASPSSRCSRLSVRSERDRDYGRASRAYDRILKVARTIADLAGKEQIESEHVSEAIEYRTMDRQFWI